MAASSGGGAAAHQCICTECGKPFLSSAAGAKTCSQSHRNMRSRRKKRQAGAFTEFAQEQGGTQAAMQRAADEALENLPAVAREVLADELRPVVREHLSGRVLQSIGDMVDLLPLAQDALREDLTAVRLVMDGDGNPIADGDSPDGWMYAPDGDRRQKAVALVLKYTVGQPGLAPQPEAPAQAPMVVHFNGMPAPSGFVDATAEVIELGMNERLCDTCHEPKDVTEFVGGSNRCETCHEANRERVQAAIAERTQNAS